MRRRKKRKKKAMGGDQEDLVPPDDEENQRNKSRSTTPLSLERECASDERELFRRLAAAHAFVLPLPLVSQALVLSRLARSVRKTVITWHNKCVKSRTYMHRKVLP